jgi:hypothetical protein
MRTSRVLIFLASLALLVSLWPGASLGAPGGLQRVKSHRSLTGKHEWYQQTYNGYAVLGAYVGRHYDKSGRLVKEQDGRKSVGGSVASSPTVSSDDARAAAGAESDAVAELVVVPGKSAYLAWAVYSSSGVRTLVDATSGKVARRDVVVKEATGRGKVFDPNPVVTLRDQSLTDNKDADYAALQPAYFIRTLTNLDGSGFLSGDYADVKGTTSRAYSPTLDFIWGRSDPRFEQTMVYYDFTSTQTYIHSLGFTNINNEPQNAKVDQFGGDNSFYYPKQDFIKLGKGGVDDAEDADVTLHEYGHAIQDDQVPDFGVGHDAGSIGEGFSDYWAVTMSVPVNGGYEVPCVADWDSISYTSTEPHCLRRVDLDLTVADANGRIHHDGQIWSRALWEIHQDLGRTTADTIILEAQFSFAPDTSWRDAALATVDAAQRLYGSSAAAVVRQAFEERGIL